MKLKGVNPVEQHAEKVVLALVSAVFLVVLTMQFLYQPNMVKVGQKEVPPQLAFAEVEREANILRGRISEEPTDLPQVNIPSIYQEFRTKLDGPAVDAGPAVAFGPAAEFTGDTAGAGRAGQGTQVAAVEVPAPSGLFAASYMVTIDPLEWIANEALRPLLPPVQPFDKASASVECTFDGAALRSLLVADPDAEGPIRPLPINWWNDRLAILGLELEREELLSDGSWGNSSIISGMLGRFDIAEWTAGDSSLGLELAAAEALRSSDSFQRPEFYPTIAGPDWLPPSEATTESGGPELDPAVSRAVKQLRSVDSRLDSTERALADLSQRSPGPGRAPPGAGRPGVRGAEPDEGGSPNPDRDQRRREQLQQTRDRLLRDRQRIVAELENLGYTSEGEELQRDAGQPAAAARRVPLLEDPAVRLWAHDLTVEPGKTYRYRARVLMNNPAFGRGASLVADQKDLTEERLWRGAASGWTSPIKVDDPVYYFFLSASEQGLAGAGARATAEVFKFYYGYWRKGAVILEPGDTFLADADVPEGLVIFDLARLEKGERPEAPEQVPGIQLPTPVEQPISPRGTPGEETIVVPPDGGRPPRGDPREPVAPAPGVGPENPPADLVGEPAPRKITVSLAAVLLDVAGIPSASRGAADTRAQAVIRTPTGAIALRSPEDDKQDPVYRRLQASAKEGEQQGQAAPTDGERRLPGEIPGPRRNRDEEDGGGGGGGG